MGEASWESRRCESGRPSPDVRTVLARLNPGQAASKFEARSYKKRGRRIDFLRYPRIQCLPPRSGRQSPSARRDTFDNRCRAILGPGNPRDGRLSKGRARFKWLNVEGVNDRRPRSYLFRNLIERTTRCRASLRGTVSRHSLCRGWWISVLSCPPPDPEAGSGISPHRRLCHTSAYRPSSMVY